MDDISRLRGVLDETGRLVDGVGEEHWSLATPCEGWDVRDLVEHVVRGNGMFAEIARGEEPRATPLPDLAAAFGPAADDLVAAYAEPGALERMMTLPVATMPGAQALWLRAIENLTHGWDLARATGQQPAYDDATTAQAIAVSRKLLDGLDLSERSPFDPSRPVADDAPALDRLAALLGRTV